MANCNMSSETSVLRENPAVDFAAKFYFFNRSGDFDRFTRF